METLSELLASISRGPAIAGLVLAAALVFLTANWRLSLIALLFQYILVGYALSHFIQGEIVIAKILVGVLAVAILYLTAQRIQDAKGSERERADSHQPWGLHIDWGAGPLGLPLRFLAVLLVGLGIVSLFEVYRAGPVPTDVAFAACWLGSMGLIGLVVSSEPLRVASAALTILAGFDLVYAILDQSLAVTGFFGVLTLLAALAFAYLALVQGLPPMGLEGRPPNPAEQGPGGSEEAGS
jgi:hypothetical protein